MSKQYIANYPLIGLATVAVYTEAKMAEALGISTSELVDLLEHGNEYCLNYYAHRLTAGEYLFRPETYNENIDKWQCVQSGGHRWQRNGRKRTCRDCPAERWD